MSTSPSGPTRSPRRTPAWPEQHGVRRVRIDGLWARTTGDRDVLIAAIDSGVDPSNRDLKGRVLDGYDFVNGDSDPRDDYGHGTAVATIATAAGHTLRSPAPAGDAVCCPSGSRIGAALRITAVAAGAGLGAGRLDALAAFSSVLRFADVAGTVHQAHVAAIAAAGITTGCDGQRFCPAARATAARRADRCAR
jgi:subtilisin family serine protease